MNALKIPTRAELEALIKDVPLDNLRLLLDAEECEQDLFTYYKRSWSAYEPASFQWGWHLEAIADHLMAVSDGTIRRLLINIPPRFSKTAMVSIAWPTWTWTNKPKQTPLLGPGVQFLCVSYGSDKAEEDAVTARRLIKSEWFQERWGEKSENKRVLIAKDRDNQGRYDTTAGGSRISVGIEASILGRGGNIKIIDDAHKPDEVESDLVRDGVIRAYDETLSSRENDPNISAEVIIMQRLHEADLSGHVLERFGGDPDKGGFVHLCLPAEYDPARHCSTIIGWDDPREEEGESLWPERYSPEALDRRRTQEGPFSWSAKYQQIPVPRGGGILKADWWRTWEPDAFPAFSTVLVSLDTASTEKEENDESALTAWGAWADSSGRPNIMLIDAWEGFLEFARLLETTTKMCQKHKADILLIEAKNVGQAVAQEARRMFSRRDFSVIEFNPKGDKVARARSIQHMFSGDYMKDAKTGLEYWTGGVIWAPDKEWAQMAIDRCASFPKGRRKGVVDTCTQAIKYLRDNGIIIRPEEYDDEQLEQRMYRKPMKPRYDV